MPMDQSENSFSAELQIHAHIISVAQKVARFVNSDAKSFMFLWNILLKDHSSFAQHNHFIHSKMFCRIVHFTKFVVQCVKNVLYLPKSVVVWVIIVFKMKECGRSNHMPSCLNKMQCSTLWTNNLCVYVCVCV
jgi:hypothetical protein